MSGSLPEIKYTAVIVEFREHPAYAYVFDNFFSTLPPEWGFTVIYGQRNNTFVNTIVDDVAAKYGQPHRILKRVELPHDNMTMYEYSELLKGAEFYDMIDTEIFMIFQTDTLLLAENIHKLDFFLQYDYVGAPWINGCVGNGGLSLRRKSKMLETIAVKGHAPVSVLEDVYFCLNNPVRMHIPRFRQAMEFSVETVFFNAPVGVHKFWGHLNPNERGYLIQRYPPLAELCRLNGHHEPPRPTIPLQTWTGGTTATGRGTANQWFLLQNGRSRTRLARGTIQTGPHNK